MAASLGYAKSTVHRHLSTLKRLGYVVEDDNGHHVGLRFLHLGWYAQNRHPGYKLAGARSRRSSRKRANAPSSSSRSTEKRCTPTERSANTPFTPIRDSVVGSRSTQPPERRFSQTYQKKQFEITEQAAFEPITDATITAPDELFEELAVVRERGYRFNIQENLAGLHSVDVPVRDSDEVIGALSVSGPSHRLKGERFESELPYCWEQSTNSN